MRQPLRITPQVAIVDPSGRTTKDGFNLFQGILDQVQSDSGTVGTALQPADIGVTVQAHSAVLDGTTASYTAAKDAKLATVQTNADNTATALYTAFKAAPIDADLAFLGNSAIAGNPLSYTTWSAVKAFLKTYFDTLYQPLIAALTTWAAITRATGFDTFATTPTSANLRALLADEVGTGAAYFVGGALGTPASGVATNLTGLPNASVIGLGTAALQNTGTSGANLPFMNGTNTWSGNQTYSGFVKSTGTAGIGYATGAGGTVTQITNKGTAITLNAVCGQITLSNAALAAGAIQNILFNNSTMAATDTMVINHQSVGTIGAYTVNGRCGAGAGAIDLRNNTAGSLSEAIVLQFALIKAVNS